MIAPMRNMTAPTLRCDKFGIIVSYILHIIEIHEKIPRIQRLPDKGIKALWSGVVRMSYHLWPYTALLHIEMYNLLVRICSSANQNNSLMRESHARIVELRLSECFVQNGLFLAQREARR